MNMEGHSMNLESSSMNVECVPSISSVCHFHKSFTLKLVKLLMLWESYQKWSSTWDCDSIYSIESVLMVTQLDLSKNPYGFLTNQSYICHSWFRLNSLFFETPCISWQRCGAQRLNSEYRFAFHLFGRQLLLTFGHMTTIMGRRPKTRNQDLSRKYSTFSGHLVYGLIEGVCIFDLDSGRLKVLFINGQNLSFCSNFSSPFLNRYISFV